MLSAMCTSKMLAAEHSLLGCECAREPVTESVVPDAALGAAAEKLQEHPARTFAQPAHSSTK
jgi:hypothetical protein